MYVLQSRWKLEENALVYYGLRNRENLFKNKVRVNKKQVDIINLLPKELTKEEKIILSNLLDEQVVLENNKKHVPESFEEATFCKSCVSNDFMIPGLEFKDGLCPMCQTKDVIENFKSVIPVINRVDKNKKTRFDIALFYTGGKDSSYLLYYLSKVLNLRVLALTWEIPYISESAKQSIENAKKKLSNVEFITRKMSDQDLQKVYNRLYELNENTCACPSLAYVLFYPDLVENKVPFFVVGNEPVQLIGLYYNHMAPKISYQFASNKFLNILINVGRVITIRPPYKPGQFQTMAMMKQLAYGNSLLTKLGNYKNELLANIIKSIHEVEHLLKPLKRSIRRSSRTGNIPAFIQIDFNDICGGHYDWQQVKEIIINEVGWVGPSEKIKGLHSSCNIEKCKEYSQFQRFYHMRSTIIPFSALEMSLASQKKHISKENAIKELKEAMGFSLKEVPECKIMKDYLKK